MKNDSASLLSARVHLALRDRLARMEFQEGMETRELQEHLEEEDLQDHLVPMALQEHQGSMGKMAFLELLGLLEPQARMVQEEFLENRECQDPKDLREHQAHVEGLVRRVLKDHQVLLENLGFLVFEGFQVLMGLLAQRDKWATGERAGPQVQKGRQEISEDQDLQGFRVLEVLLEELESRE